MSDSLDVSIGNHSGLDPNVCQILTYQVMFAQVSDYEEKLEAMAEQLRTQQHMEQSLQDQVPWDSI